MTIHQQKQIEIINQIEKQIRSNALDFSTVDPVKDYESDPRICLTSIHLPHQDLLTKIQKTLIDPLRNISPEHYYYSKDSLHVTIKSVRVINDPPHFTKEDIEKAKKVFAKVVPKHHKFKVYFYRLLLFPYNLALIGTTDKELDDLVIDLDRKLKEAGVPDDKIYANSQYFFSNITLARFPNKTSQAFKRKVEEISKTLSFEPYTVDSITLLTSNAILKKRYSIGTWKLG